MNLLYVLLVCFSYSYKAVGESTFFGVLAFYRLSLLQKKCEIAKYILIAEIT